MCSRPSVRAAALDTAALEVRTIEVGPLEEDALVSLASRMLPPATARNASLRFAEQAQGSPFFAAELARAAALQPEGQRLPTLHDAIRVHVQALPLAFDRADLARR